MKIIKKSKTTIKISKTTFDYENGVFCDTVLTDNKKNILFEYNFYTLSNNNKIPLFYISDISEYVKYGCPYWKIGLEESLDILDVTQVVQFEDIDKLYHFTNYESYGLMKNYKGEVIPTFTMIDHYTIESMLDKTAINSFYEKCDKLEYIDIDGCDIYFIPTPEMNAVIVEKLIETDNYTLRIKDYQRNIIKYLIEV